MKEDALLALDDLGGLASIGTIARVLDMQRRNWNPIRNALGELIHEGLVERPMRASGRRDPLYYRLTKPLEY